MILGAVYFKQNDRLFSTFEDRIFSAWTVYFTGDPFLFATVYHSFNFYKIRKVRILEIFFLILAKFCAKIFFLELNLGYLKGPLSTQ